MGETYHHPFSTFHGPTYSTHDGFYSSVSSAHSAELSSLKSQTSVLQYQLSERDKDVSEARTVIEYLLKLNACAFTNGGTFKPVLSGQKGSDTSSTGDIFRLLDVIIKLLLGLSKSNVANPDTDGVGDTKRRSEYVSGDLLDFCDDNVALAALPAEKEIRSTQHSDASHDQSRPEVTKAHQESAAAVANTHTQLKAALGVEVDGLSEVPYVKRFAQARNPPLTLDLESTAGSPHPPCSAKGLAALNLLDLDDIDSRLSGSTRFSASDSNSFPSSLTSSFTTSSEEDEIGERVARCVRAEKTQVTTNQGGGQQDSCASSPQGTENTSNAPDHAVLETLPTATSQPASSDTDIFLPQWPSKPFIQSKFERETAITAHKAVAGAQNHGFPDFFRYGIRFRPDSSQTNIYRTLLVDNLPMSMPVPALLQRIKGGAIESVKAVDTTSITGHQSMLVTFLHETGARGLHDHSRLAPFVFGGLQARVTLLPTPTYPARKCLQVAIAQYGHTRCLEISNFPRGISPAELQQDIPVCFAMRTHRIVSKRLRAVAGGGGGVLELGFSSIAYAGQAFARLTAYKKCEQCNVRFVRDPCAEPWDDEEAVVNQGLPLTDGTVDSVEQPTQMHSPAPVAHTDCEDDAVGYITAPTSVTSTACEEKGDRIHEELTPPTTRLVDVPPTDEDHTGRLNDVQLDQGHAVCRGRGFGSAAIAAVRSAEKTSCAQQ